MLKVGAIHKTGTYEVQASPDRFCDNFVLATQKVECIDTSQERSHDYRPYLYGNTCKWVDTYISCYNDVK